MDSKEFEFPEEECAFVEMEKQPEIPYEEAVSEDFMFCDLHKIILVKDSVTREQASFINQICRDYFESEFLPLLKSKGCERPLDKKYGNVIERKLGRFEIIPPKNVVDSIWVLLRENPVFMAVNQRIHKEIMGG
jgi:hypothetical protein